MKIHCNICDEDHEMDIYYWVHSCIGFKPLTDFGIIIYREEYTKNE